MNELAEKLFTLVTNTLSDGYGTPNDETTEYRILSIQVHRSGVVIFQFDDGTITTEAVEVK